MPSTMRAAEVLLLMSLCAAPCSALEARNVLDEIEPVQRALLSSRDDVDVLGDKKSEKKKKKNKSKTESKKSEDKSKSKSMAEGNWFLTDFEGGSCAGLCSEQGLVTDHLAVAKIDKDGLKQVAKDLGYQCKGVDVLGDAATSPDIEVKNEGDLQGPCTFPEHLDEVDWTRLTGVKSRRFCYCVTEPANDPTETGASSAEGGSLSSDAIWKSQWIHPGGDDVLQHRHEQCLCYAGKGSETHAQDLHWYDHSVGEHDCEKFCNGLAGGPYHAGDWYSITRWSTKRPAVIVVHGSDADKDEKNIVGVCEFLRDAGFHVFSINYHSGDCAQDIGNAVALIKTNANVLGVDPDSIGLYGWSLGGVCAYQAGMNNAHDPLMSVKAVIDSSGCGGTGPVKSVKDLTTPPPALVLAHAENDNTIDIQDCYDLAKKAKKTQWKDGEGGKKQDIILEEWYWGSGGHNLWKNQKADLSDIIFDTMVKYLGRPCRVDVAAAYGEPSLPPVDTAWPYCKKDSGEATEKCGGMYSDPSVLGPTCAYP